MKFKIVRMCNDEAVTIIPMEAIRLDLENASSILEKNGYEVNNPGVMVKATKNSFSFTLYKSGRILFNSGVEKQEAKGLAEELYEILEKAKV